MCRIETTRTQRKRWAYRRHRGSSSVSRLAPQFKQIAIAYQVLADPDLRKKYNMMGQKNGGGGVEPNGGFQDPEEVFGSMFGGERFQDFIGTISIGG